MVVKKTDLYAILWEAANNLRGGVEPARYKDYVLTLLFFKYVSDRYKGERLWRLLDSCLHQPLIALNGHQYCHGLAVFQDESGLVLLGEFGMIFEDCPPRKSDMFEELPAGGAYFRFSHA